MKKILLILMAIVIITGCSTNSETKKNNPIDIKEGTPLLAFDEYKDFDFNNVKSLTVIKYRESGVNEEEITNIDEIQSSYNGLSRITILNESKMSCDDNTTIYRYNMKDGKKYSFEFECEWLVIGNKRYTYK